MAGRVTVGDKLPLFLYDTPYSARNRMRDLLAAKSPLVLVFMANFGHPITRTFASRYAATHAALHDGGFALVVRSRADKLAGSIGPDTLPYPLLCDAEGVLYDLLDIPQNSSTLMTYSLEGWRILREAKKQGYRAARGTPQQLPLTLILDREGTILFCHYGASLTDVPEDCAAIQSLLEELELTPDLPTVFSSGGPLSPPAEADSEAVDGEDWPDEADSPTDDGWFPGRGAGPLHGQQDDDFVPAEPVRGYSAPDADEPTAAGLFDGF